MERLQLVHPRQDAPWKRGRSDGSDGNWFIIADVQLPQLQCAEVPRLIWSHTSSSITDGQHRYLFDVLIWEKEQSASNLVSDYCSCLAADQILGSAEACFAAWSDPRRAPSPYYKLKVQITVPLGLIT